jgi:pyruvate,water dikinase
LTQSDTAPSQPYIPYPASTSADAFTVQFGDARCTNLQRVGGKCASLGALIQANAPVPLGFAVTTDSYLAMLASDRLGDEVADLLRSHDPRDVGRQEQIAKQIQQAILRRPIPLPIEAAIRTTYANLCSQFGPDAPVAVRSSGTLEDLAEASFAGQGDTYLWVTGEDAVVAKVKSCWASLFNARAIAYRDKHQISQLQGLMGVAVQRMVDATASGVAMTIDPSNGDRSKIVIEAGWGLGELVVSGEVTPDHFVVDKIMLEPVIRKIADKNEELVADYLAKTTRRQSVDDARRRAPCITDAQLKTVASLAKAMERHFKRPQDIEWAIDSHGTVMLLQCRPETVWSKRQTNQSLSKSYAVGVGGVVDTMLKPIVVKK